MDAAQDTLGSQKITAGRLIEHARRCFTHKRLRHAREFYAMAQREMAGPWFEACPSLTSRAWDAWRPVNSLGQACRTYLPHILGEKIEPVLSPGALGVRGHVKLLEMRLNRWIADSGYLAEDEAGIIDSMLCMGIWYVARRDGGVAMAVDNTTLDMGEPMAKRIDIGQFVFDPRCMRIDESPIVGHRYDVDREAMYAAQIGDPNVLAKVPNVWERVGDEESGRGEGSDERDGAADPEDYLDDRIALWDLCFVRGGRRFCCTVGSLHDNGAGFVIEPYEIVDEPEGWRYVTLGLDTVPGRHLPSSPAMAMMDYHLSRDRVLAKMMTEIEEIGRDLVVDKSQSKLAMQIQKPNQTGRSRTLYGDPSKIKELVRGGATKPTLEAFGLLTELGKETGPNVDVLGGQEGKASESATSASIRAGNGAVIVGRWKAKANEARANIMRRVTAMLLQSGDRLAMPMELPGGEVPVIWDAAELSRDISYDQFQYKIRVSNGAAGMDQRAKLRTLVELFTMAIPQAVQTAAMLGADPAKVMRVIADESGFAELDEMLPTMDSAQVKQAAAAMLQRAGVVQTGAGAGMGPTTMVGQLNADGARAIPA